MKTESHIRVGRIEDGQVTHIASYTWGSIDRTREEFEKARRFDTDCRQGNVCLDFYSRIADLEDTVTLSPEDYAYITGKTIEEEAASATKGKEEHHG